MTAQWNCWSLDRKRDWLSLMVKLMTRLALGMSGNMLTQGRLLDGLTLDMQ